MTHQFKYSLLVPTRERPEMARKFIESVYQMTSQKKNVEILFICDNEDTISKNYVNGFIAEYKNHFMDVRLLTRQRTEMLNEDYYNWAARQAIGDLIWVLADDLELLVHGWDNEVNIEVSNFFVKYPDKIICVSIKDNTPPPSHKLPKFPCFPMLTKESREALGGWILHPKVPTWGADYVTYCIFQPIDRLLILHKKNYINHKSWHTKQVGVDPTNFRIGEIFNRLKMVPHHNTDRIIDFECPTIRGQLMDKVRAFQQPK